MNYRVMWTTDLMCWTEIEADSEEEAIERVKNGERPDTDTDPVDGKERKFHCV